MTNVNLHEELTQITPEDYIGKDLCCACYKEVKEQDLAILCDFCERWIHRKCSNMTLKSYRVNRKKITFNWVCNVCRTDDILITEKPTIHHLEDSQRPESLESVGKSSKEMLILSLNCRSILNKEEEIEYICKKLEPDIL